MGECGDHAARLPIAAANNAMTPKQRTYSDASAGNDTVPPVFMPEVMLR